LIPAGAEIQIENGQYTRIHNAILEALSRVRLSPAEFRAVFFLLRKTYGFQKKEDTLSLSQWQEGTGDVRHITIAALRNLVALNIMYRRAEGNSFVYGFNKYIEQWSPDVYARDSERAERLHDASTPTGTSTPAGTPVGTNASTVPGTSNGTPTGTSASTPVGTHKRNPKDTIKETVKEKIDSDFGAAVTRYEHGIGVVTKDLREKMGVMWDELKAQGVTEWWDLAIATAKSYDAYSWPYMSKVLERSLATEKPPAPKQNGNGAAPPAPKPAKRKQRIILPDGQTAEVEV